MKKLKINIIDSLFYTNLEENTLIDDLSIRKFISVILNDIITKNFSGGSGVNCTKTY